MVLNLIFDLDGTLYSFKETGLGRQMRQLINEFLSAEFNISMDEADVMADGMYRRYGLTARGIQVDKKVSQLVVKKYCGYVHMIDYSPIKFNPTMVKAFTELAAMPNVHLWILTNATKQHAAAALAQMGISNAFRCPTTGVLRILDCFAQWALTPEHTAECKPLRVAYDLMARVARVDDDDEFVMVEDALRNLDEPKKMGWRTVFIADGRAELENEAKAIGHTVVVQGIMEAVPVFVEWASKAKAAEKQKKDEGQE